MSAEWTWDADYQQAWAPTDDPRVLAVIERDNDASGPGGDALAPTLLGDGWGTRHYRDADDVFQDPSVTAAFLRACDHYGVIPSAAGYEADGIVARYMRVFHGTEFRAGSSTVDRYANVVVFDTPAWREHVGIDPDAPSDLSGERDEWQAYLDGDVFGVGYAVRETHVLDDDKPVDLDDWRVDMECWGFYGEDYAKDAALRFDHGRPDLPPLLPIT